MLGAFLALASAALVACGDAERESGEAAATASATAPRSHESAAEAFVALAGGDRSVEVPWAPRVSYSIGGVEVGDLAAGPGLAASLRTCPDGVEEYEGRACPVSPLDTVSNLLRDGSSAVVEAGVPDVVGCTKVIGAPAPGLTAASIRPPAEDRDCFSDFVVTLYSNTAGAVERIDFTLSGP